MAAAGSQQTKYHNRALQTTTHLHGPQQSTSQNFPALIRHAPHALKYDIHLNGETLRSRPWNLEKQL